MAITMVKPDFICIGAQKAGTQWLYDQVLAHPDGWMPPIKEVKFFKSGAYNRTERLAKRRLNTYLKQSYLDKIDDPKGIEFLRRIVFESYKIQQNPCKFYRRLFQVADDCITGDTSPQYSVLNDNEIASATRCAQRTKFMFIIREPISRLWSQACMHVRLGRGNESLIYDLEEFRAFCNSDSVRQLSFQSNVIKKWRRHLGLDRFKVFVMDDLLEVPELFRGDVFRYIGLDPNLCVMDAGFNKKEGRSKPPMPAAFKEFLNEYFENEHEVLRSLAKENCVVSNRPTELSIL